MSIPLSEKKKERNIPKNMWSSTWKLHQHNNITFYFFFFFNRNYVGVFITLLLLWILHSCIQYDVQEMSQIIMSKLNQLQIQIKYIHYTVIRRLCVCKGLYTVFVCGFFNCGACAVRHATRFSCLSDCYCHAGLQSAA